MEYYLVFLTGNHVQVYSSCIIIRYESICVFRLCVLRVRVSDMTRRCVRFLCGQTWNLYFGRSVLKNIELFRNLNRL